MAGPDMFSVLRKRLLLRGFIVSDFSAKQADFLRDASAWIREGRLKYREDIVDGLEKAPASFLGLLQGKNFGKMLVKVGVVPAEIPIAGSPTRPNEHGAR
jgi:NADPH-dependent curcumin reductase CurA